MKKHSTITDKSTIWFERGLSAPIDRVWDCLTTADGLSMWIADGDIGNVGSRYRLLQDTDRVPLRMPGSITGVVKHKNKPRRLVITWAGAKDGIEMPKEESLVTFDLGEKEGDTLLSIKHEQITPGFLAMVAAGWDMHVTTLDAALRGAPLPDTMALFKEILPLYVKDAEAKGDTIGEAGKAILASLPSQKN